MFNLLKTKQANKENAFNYYPSKPISFSLKNVAFKGKYVTFKLKDNIDSVIEFNKFTNEFQGFPKMYSENNGNCVVIIIKRLRYTPNFSKLITFSLVNVWEIDGKMGYNFKLEYAD